jgi:hypothetical protein
MAFGLIDSGFRSLNAAIDLLAINSREIHPGH